MALGGKIEQGSNFVVQNDSRLFFDAQEIKGERTYSSSMNLDSPLSGILISAHSNGLRVRQLCRLGGSK